MKRKEWTDEKLFKRLLKNKSEKAYWDNIHELRTRSNQYVFEKCLEFCDSQEPIKKIIGVDVLAQLGPTPRPFYKESIKLFFNMLEKEDHTEILASLLYAVGHNNASLNKKQISILVAFTSHANTNVRRSLVHSLLGIEDDKAIKSLIVLSKDKVSSIRDWATFGLGSQIQKDNTEIRNALWDRVNDKNEDVRLEAIVGLAERNDFKVKKIIMRELRSEEFGTLLFQAIELLNDKEFLPLLRSNLKSAEQDDGINPSWLKDLKELIGKLEKTQ